MTKQPDPPLVARGGCVPFLLAFAVMTLLMLAVLFAPLAACALRSCG